MAIAYPYTVPADRAFMGKARTYSAQTEFRQHAVRLRAIVDNPRDPAEAGAIGRDWAVDDPAAIIEEGSNANGSYTLYAGGKSWQRHIVSLKRFTTGAASGVWVFPTNFNLSHYIGTVTVIPTGCAGYQDCTSNYLYSFYPNRCSALSKSIDGSDSYYVLLQCGIESIWYES